MNTGDQLPGESDDDRASYPSMLRVLRTRSDIQAYYDKIARFYDLLAERSEDAMRREGLRMLDAVEGEHILEIGFGTGHSLADIADRVGPAGRVYGVDISSEMTRLAAQRIAKREYAYRVQVWTGDAAELPLDGESIDGIFLSFVLEIFDTPDMGNFLGECRRVLKPGGRISVVSISREDPKDRMVRVFEWTHRHFPNLLDCRPIHVRRAIDEASFTIVRSEVRHMWLPVEIVLGRKTGHLRSQPFRPNEQDLKFNKLRSHAPMSKETIDQTHQQFLLAMKAGNSDSLDRLLTDDIVFFPPHEHTRHGRKAVIEWMEDAFNQIRTDRLDVSDREVVVSGDWAFESGSFVAVIAAREGADRTEGEGRYLTVWQRQPGGAWKIARNIWNSSLPRHAG